MKTSLLFLALFSVSNLFGQTSGNGVTDIDGNFYETVTIGTQVWMSKNLDVATFRNGDSIPQVQTNEEWKKAGENKQPAWCYYENDPANGAKYGKLYNWYAVNDPRGLAPEGYHVPTDDEWTILQDHLGGDAKKMKSTSGWFDEGNGTDQSGFNGLPGGNRYFDGNFDAIDSHGYWWSSTENATDFTWYRGLNFFYDDVDRSNGSKDNGFSVRCLRD